MPQRPGLEYRPLVLHSGLAALLIAIAAPRMRAS
jgi:hypothetical protein